MALRLAVHGMGRLLMPELLTVSDLPPGFSYPAEFIRVVELGLTQLEPWWIIEGKALRDRYSGLTQRYPSRTLVPFAVRQDRDDVACWEGSAKHVVIIHDFADPGWEQRAEFDGFYPWLRKAFDDFIEFGGG
jgi:hypothetical protein